MHVSIPRRSALAAVMALAAGPAGSAFAQDSTRTAADSSRTPTGTTATAPAAPASRPAGPDFSGVLFAHYQSGGTKAERLQGQQNRFELERAYLTFRAPAGDRLSIRITADVFQQRNDAADDFYGGWVFRAKYAYAEYALRQGPRDALRAVARLGMLHTPIIEFEETFWIRGVANSAVEREGFFSSADVGVATSVTLPNQLGEVYFGAFNGNGYTARESDRFKDVGGRLSFTPLMRRTGLLRTLAITPWYYKGYRASGVAALREGRQKDRYGLHVGIRDPRLVVGGQLAQREDEPTGIGPVRSITGRVISTYTIFKPVALLRKTSYSPLNLLFRYDHVRPDVNADPHHRFFVAGLGWDLNRRSQFWADFQGQEAKGGSAATDLKTLFLRVIVNY